MEEQYLEEKQVPKPSNYLGLTIAATVVSAFTLCFYCTGIVAFVFGIISLIKATKVDGLYNSGQYEAAIKASKSAKTFGLVSIIIAGVEIVVVLLFYIIIFATQS